jgi:uncharacterized protein (DUF1697 family)
MQTLIVLLRGVNVGGAGTGLPMDRFRAVLSDLGCTDVRTYIQSGNAVARSDRDPAALAEDIRSAIRLPNGTQPMTVVLTLAEIEQSLAANPYPAVSEHPKTLHVMFLSHDAVPDLAALASLATPGEGVALRGRCLYLLTPDGAGRSRLANGAPRHLGGGTGTARNLSTVLALAAMARATAGD